MDGVRWVDFAAWRIAIGVAIFVVIVIIGAIVEFTR